MRKAPVLQSATDPGGMVRNVNPSKVRSVWVGLALTVLVVAVVVWQLLPSKFVDSARAEASGDLPMPFEEFRTIMIRNSPTRTIVEHGGLELKSEEVVDLKLDLSRDRRPLLNALLRQSQSDVMSKKRIVVALNNDEIHAEDLELMQDAAITPEAMDVSTESTGRAGDLKSYRTSLHAESNGESTKVRVTTEIEIEKQLGKLFHGTASARLKTSATDAVKEQMAALKQFAMHNAKK